MSNININTHLQRSLILTNLRQTLDRTEAKLEVMAWTFILSSNFLIPDLVSNGSHSEPNIVLHIDTHTHAPHANSILSCWLRVLLLLYGPLSTWAALSLLAWQSGSSPLLSAPNTDKPEGASSLQTQPLVITKSRGGRRRWGTHTQKQHIQSTQRSSWRICNTNVPPIYLFISLFLYKTLWTQSKKK